VGVDAGRCSTTGARHRKDFVRAVAPARSQTVERGGAERDDPDVQEELMGRLTRMSRHALSGWRNAVGEPVAVRLSKVTSLHPDTARALVGAAFFLASLVYVVKTVTAAVRAERR
jgi:hypothetical protein